ncbi:MAG: hypothetical protein IPN03_09355 [Holophagales bacterium]|nr:hypothetical protein [Holophagales bacterium]MBK9373919.1 hypothetical protein [Holophagales bacterium]
MSRSQGVPAVLVASLGLGVVLGACGTQKSPTEPSDVPDPTATFARVQAEVFTPSCALSGCHAGPNPQQGQDLSAGRAYSQIVNVRSAESSRLRIAPGDPDASYLISKVKGDATITGNRMPPGSALSPDEVQLLVDWVRRGAPND